MGFGFFATFVAFLVPTWVEWQIALGARPSIGWQVVAYLILTAGEVLVSITCLEFSYTQAPPSMKSFVMALSLLAVALGNLFTSLVNLLLQSDGSARLSGASYYFFFSTTMLVACMLFVVVATRYRERTYLQDEAARP
jgi:POT family proton-dependent oligopeptide transporter